MSMPAARRLVPAAQRLARYAAIGLLMEKFPAAFVRYGDRRPLKLDISDDLLARGVERSAVTAGLQSYCRGVGYLKALKAGTPRIDLDGNPAGTVTADEAKAVAEQLTVLDLKAAQRRAKARVAAAAAKKKRDRGRREREGEAFAPPGAIADS